MTLLALQTQPWPKQYMATVKDDEATDRVRKGIALKALRKSLGHTQESAATAHDVTAQAWQHFEGGRRHLSDQKVAALVKSIGGTLEAFQLELDKVPHGPMPMRTTRARGGVQDRTASFKLPFGGIAHGGAMRPHAYDEADAEVVDFTRYFSPGTEVLRLGGMSMFPYADSGGFVTYNRLRPAQRGRGCVIVMKDGAKLVKRFEHYDDKVLVVTELWPEEKRLEIPIEEVEGVYAIGLRGD